METENKPGLFYRSLQGGKWYLMSVVINKGFSFVSFFILARILTPADYGVFAVLLMAIALATQAFTIPFGDALVQHKEDIEEYLNTVWTFDLLRSALITVGFLVAAPWIGDFFHLDASGVLLLQVGSVLLFLPALGSPRQVLLVREMDFKKLFWRDAISQTASFAVAIVIAMYFSRSAWALLASQLAASLVANAATYFFLPGWPRFSFAFARLKILGSFTFWSYLQDVFEFILQQLDKLVVGNLLTSHELGWYSKAKDLPAFVTNTISSVVIKVGFPALSRVQDKPELVREGFFKTLDVMMLTGLPFSLLLLFEGGAVISFFLGQPWLGVVPGLKLFAFGSLALAFSRAATTVLAAKGRPDLNFRNQVVHLILLIPAIAIGWQLFGMNGIAGGTVLVWTIVLGYVAFQTRRELQLPARRFLPTFIVVTIASLVTLAVDVLFRRVRGEGVSDLFIVFLQLPILGLCYYGVLLIAGLYKKQGPYMTLRSIYSTLRSGR